MQSHPAPIKPGQQFSVTAKRAVSGGGAGTLPRIYDITVLLQTANNTITLLLLGLNLNSLYGLH